MVGAFLMLGKINGSKLNMGLFGISSAADRFSDEKLRSGIRVIGILLLCLVFVIPLMGTAFAAKPAPLTLDPKTIPKFVNQLDGPPPVYVPTVVTDPVTGAVISHNYTINVTEFYEQILPAGFPATKVWGYGGVAKDAVTGAFLGYVRGSPAPSFAAVRGIPINVEWVNNITSPHMFAVDPTLHWANPNMMMMPMPPVTAPVFPPGYPDAQYPVPLVTHLHGGEVQSTSDGNPNAWFTSTGLQGSAYYTYSPTNDNAAVYHYPNAQPAATLWYHDHALGITRINVMSGLAGFYLLSDANDAIAPLLPSGKYDVPLAIQDRTFNIDGSLFFPSVGLNPTIHPYWMPEFFGNTIIVNGKAWPNMNVDQGQYRFRLLDGSNARFYTLRFSNKMPFTVIGSDGGYLKTATTLTEVTIAPGERIDILVDFSNIAPGTKIVLENTAKTPFPKGAPADPQTTGQIMQFTVTANPGFTPKVLPTTLNPTLTGAFPSLPAPTVTRTLTLTEVMGPAGPTEILLNGQKWSAAISEVPQLGTTEEWVIVNPTADTHPIHLHLVQFQIVSRQQFQATKYYNDWVKLNGMPPLNHPTVTLPVTLYLQGKPTAPLPNEQGWKDTIQVNPGEVTIIRVRFAPIDGSGAYPFDATEGPGYVWHCHILDHEDNEMMRPYRVV